MDYVSEQKYPIASFHLLEIKKTVCCHLCIFFITEIKLIPIYLYCLSTFCPGSGAVGITHMDGAGTEEGVHSLLQRVQELANGYPEGRLELQMVGGFVNTRRNYSEELFSSIMSKLRKYYYAQVQSDGWFSRWLLTFTVL